MKIQQIKSKLKNLACSDELHFTSHAYSTTVLGLIKICLALCERIEDLEEKNRKIK